MTWTDNPQLTVATHGAPHHADELVALALLRRWAAQRGTGVRVVFLRRQRIASWADRFDVLVDIGGRDDPPTGRFDHHQAVDRLAALRRSSAELVFDYLFRDDPCRDYVQPMIAAVGRLDLGQYEPQADPQAARGRSLTSLPALLRALGGVRYCPAASRRCLDVVETLVRYWFDQGVEYADAGRRLASARRVGAGIFLEDGRGSGPALQERLQTEPAAFVGFATGAGRFQVAAVRGTDGVDRIRFPADLPGATFVHPAGFLAVFPDAQSAAAAVACLHPREPGRFVPVASNPDHRPPTTDH